MELEEPQFSTQLFGGYQKKAVEKFIKELLHKIQSLALKNEELQKHHTLLTQQIAHYQHIEKTLLQHIEELKKEKELIRIEKEKALQEYEKVARVKIIEAEAEAKRILDKAKKNAEDILSEAHKNSQEKIERMRHDLKILEYNYNVVECHGEKFISSVLSVIEETLLNIQELAALKKIAMTEDKINKTNRLLNETALRKSKQFPEKTKEETAQKEVNSPLDQTKSVAFANLPDDLDEENPSTATKNTPSFNNNTSFFDQFS